MARAGSKRVDGAFVYAEGQLAAAEAFEFAETFFYFVAEVDQTFRVVLQERSGIGHAHWARAADEERLAEVVLEFANGEAYSRLRAVEAFGGAREAAFLRNHQKYLEFAEIHAVCSRTV